MRDTGYSIEFWINSNNSTTWSDHIPWNFTIDGVTHSGTFYYHPNSGWQQIIGYGTTNSQNVTVGLGATGTSGFGGPTSLTVFISRATVPQAPNPVQFANLSDTSVTASFTPNGNGGAAVDANSINYGTDPNNPVQNINNNNPATITGLAPGVTYYFWANQHNSVGWGPFSPRTQITTLRVPFAPTFSVQNPAQTTVQANLTPNGDGGSAVTGRQVAYVLGVSTNVADHTNVYNPATGATIFTVPNLQPGQTYTFWGRAINAYGGGDWSDPAYITTVAGAFVNVGGAQKKAIPWVKSGGVWRIAQPWSKVAGVWKESM
jgi:hypothetical protein